MQVLDGKERDVAQHWLGVAVNEALKSRCEQSQRGVIIVQNNVLIGRGCNNPPLEMACVPETCYKICAQYCVHAEQNAILNAADSHQLSGATMYHVRVKNHVVMPSKEPCCVECSKLVLQSGIAEFVMKTEQGVCRYAAQEFHELSLTYLVKHKS